MRSPAALELRSPQSKARELRRDTAYVEAAVAVVLVISIITLVYVLTRDVSVAVGAARDFA
jgi:hypothetical protein